MKPTLHVAVAVIRNQRGEVLVTQRPRHVHKGGCWEFPGGKVEPGEQVRQALARELYEELGIDVIRAQSLIQIPHEYAEHPVLLDVWEVSKFSGAAHGREGQPLRWVTPQALDDYIFPEANRPIIRAAQLPGLYMITGGPADRPDLFMEKLRRALERGIRLVQLRAKGLDHGHYIELARQAASLCERYRAVLLLNAEPDVLAQVPGAQGVQLSSDRLGRYSKRPIAEDKWLGASCHSLAQLRQAEAVGADFALLSPVLATATHPDAEPLGWKAFQQWVRSTTIPVYALGGMSAALQFQARDCGGQGVAAISALWEG